MAHLKMMSAAQPFISGAISKTVNMPNQATPQEIRDTYMQAWKMGLKCVAIYRDGSKRSQPLNTQKKSSSEAAATSADDASAQLTGRLKELEREVTQLRDASGRPLRRRLPETRMAVNHKFNITGHEGYLNVGLFEDGQPGELFITMAKEGSTIGGLMDTIATLTSMALQYGVPLDALVRKFSHQRFEPSGFTKNREIPTASSLTDYIFRWMAFQFISGYREQHAPDRGQQELPIPGLREVEAKRLNKPVPDLPVDEDDKVVEVKSPASNAPAPRPGSALTASFVNMLDAPACPNCGQVTVRNGKCFKCLNCGESLGCS
jgi:ribonucleoside-diphosphate reductase alpha chain